MLGLGSWNQFHKISSYLKDLFHQFPWSTKCLTVYPEFPSGGVEAGPRAAQGPVSAEAEGKCFCCCCSIAGKCSCACKLSLYSRVWFFVIPWTVVCQTFLSMGFSGQEYLNGLPFPPLGNLSHPGTKRLSLASPALASRFFTTSTISEAHQMLLQVPICSWHCHNSVFLFGIGAQSQDSGNNLRSTG